MIIVQWMITDFSFSTYYLSIDLNTHLRRQLWLNHSPIFWFTREFSKEKKNGKTEWHTSPSWSVPHFECGNPISNYQKGKKSTCCSDPRNFACMHVWYDLIVSFCAFLFFFIRRNKIYNLRIWSVCRSYPKKILFFFVCFLFVCLFRIRMGFVQSIREKMPWFYSNPFRFC